MWLPNKIKVLAIGFCLAFISAHADEPWTLERVISQAITNNPDARLAQHRIAAAEATLAQADAAFRPSVQFQSSYMRTDNPMQVFGSALNQRSFSSSLDFNNVPDADNLNVKGLVTVPLYAGGKLSAGRDSAKAITEAEHHNANAVRNELEFAAARAFHIIVKSGEIVRAAEAQSQSLATNLIVARNRFDAGAMLKSDVLDVEVQLAQARENVARAKNARALFNRALKNLLGIESGEVIILADVPAFAAASADSITAVARPEILSLQQQERAAQAEVRASKGGYRPRVHAFGSVDYDHGWTFNGSGESYTAGIMLQWDLFDGKLTRARVRRAEAELASVKEQSRKARLAIDFEVDAARLSLNEANERLAVLEKSVALAAESAQLTRNRFAQGVAIASQLLDAESALTGARVRRAEAEADQRIAVAALRKALGRTQLPKANE